MSAFLSLPLTSLAVVAFIYALLEARIMYQDTREETEVWLYVMWSTVAAGLIPFVHLFQAGCNPPGCVLSRSVAAEIELLLLVITMTLTMVAIRTVKTETERGRYG